MDFSVKLPPACGICGKSGKRYIRRQSKPNIDYNIIGGKAHYPNQSGFG